MKRVRNKIELDASKTYRRVTVQLYGRGAVVRDQVNGSVIKTKTQYVVRAGQLIFSRIDARNGAFDILPHELDGVVVSGNFQTYEIDESQLDRRYLGWYVRRRRFWDQCNRVSEGTTNRVPVRVEDLERFKIPIPTLSEQRRVVAKIEQLAAKIDEVRRLRRNVLEQSSALTSSLHFSLSQNRVAELAQLLELDEHREIVLPNVEYPQIGIRGFGGGLFVKSAVQGAETTYRYFNRLEAGQVILSQVKGWEGAVAVSRAEHAGFFVSPEYRTFICIAGMCDPAYMDNVVTSPWFHTLLAEATRGQGARRERTRPELFLRIKIPMPHYESQRRAVPILNRVRMDPQLQSETAAELDALLPSILDKAFKGELISMKAAEQVRATTPYKDDAAVVCLLLSEMEKFQRPTTEFFIQKHIFTAKHHLHLPVKSLFVRKVAGPWSHELRRKAIFTATKMNWLRWEKSRLVPGSAFEKALSHASTVLGERAAQLVQLVEDLKSFGNNGLERWTTVLKVVEDLKETQQPITRANIQHEIDTWPGKRLKEIFAKESIDHTIVKMVKYKWLPQSAGQ